MIKIGILTFHFSHNIGSALQTYALRKYLLSLGAGVECNVINYEKKDWIPIPLFSDCKSNVLQYVKRRIVFSLVKIRIAYFVRFQRRYCGLTKRYGRADLQKLNETYDLFVFGGDQIWCVENHKVDETYFGDFVRDESKKVSYAPSFGITKLPENRKANIAKLLSKFKMISVREKSGQEIVNDLLGYRPQIVLDPVFLINREAYDDLAGGKKVNTGNCFCYIRNKNYGCAMEFATIASKKKNLMLQTVSDTDLNGKYIPIIGPERWLRLVKSADLIVTNSFHGMCFSIIYHKEFYVDANQNETRILNILEMLGLEDRLLPLKDGKEAKPINWNNVDNIIAKHRQESFDYIKQAIFN